MRECLRLADAAGKAGNVPVGALVLRAGEVLARAAETLPAGNDLIGHAELLAVRLAGAALNTRNLHGCTLVTTAEPCWMCSYLIRDARISRVVIGAPTAFIGGVSSRYPLLTDPAVPGWDAPPEIISGVLADECRALRAQYGY